jgi:hypothetical protein
VKNPKALTFSAIKTLKGNTGIKHSKYTIKNPNNNPPDEIKFVLNSIIFSTTSTLSPSFTIIS